MGDAVALAPPGRDQDAARRPRRRHPSGQGPSRPGGGDRLARYAGPVAINAHDNTLLAVGVACFVVAGLVAIFAIAWMSMGPGNSSRNWRMRREKVVVMAASAMILAACGQVHPATWASRSINTDQGPASLPVAGRGHLFHADRQPTSLNTRCSPRPIPIQVARPKAPRVSTRNSPSRTRTA